VFLSFNLKKAIVIKENLFIFLTFTPNNLYKVEISFIIFYQKNTAMKKIVLVLGVFFFLTEWNVSACTTAVISGKATKDGTPMLWKNRDIRSLNNKINVIVSVPILSCKGLR